MSKKPKLNKAVKSWLVFLFLLYAASLPAIEGGRFSLTYQNQSFKTIAGDSDYFSSLNSIYLNLWQSLGKGSSFNFAINYYFDRGISQVASYNLGFQQVPLGKKFKMDVDFGTISYPLSSLPFFGSFNPTAYRGLKGGKITITSAKNDLILFGGQLYGNFGFLNEKSKVYGARTIFRPSRRWTLGTGWMKVLDMPSLADNSFMNDTGDYDIFSVDSAVMPVNNLYLLGDFRYIFDQSHKNKDGFSVKTGTYYNAGKISFEIFYNYLSPHYPHLTNIFLQDHNGITIMGQYRPVYWLSLFGGLDTFNEPLRNNLSQPPPGNFLTYRFGSIFSLKSLPQFYINYNKSIKEFPQGDAGPSTNLETDFNMLFLSLSQQYRRFYWSINYNLGEFNKPGESAGNYRLNRIFLNLRWTYPTGHYIYFTGAFEQSDWAMAILDNKNLNFQLGANIRMSAFFQFNIQGDYGLDKYTSRLGENRRIAFGGGIIYRFKPLKINFALRYQYARGEDVLYAHSNRYRHQAFFSINRDFHWGTESSRIGRALNGDKGSGGTGKLKGAVFVDINQNDLQDEGEEGVADIYILVDNFQAARTDKNGHFSISDIPVGPHQVSLDLRNIPAFYEAGREKMEIITKKRKADVVNLTVIPVGMITGRVVLDINENGMVENDEPALRDIRVNLLKEGKLLRWEFTNAKGVFTFDNLRPGSYTLKVDEESVFERYNGVDKSVLEITIKPWEEKKGLLILLNEYKKGKVRKVLDY